MEKLGLNEIRERFLSFYETKEHFRRGSFSLIPEKDKSLLIINSGMAPLKPYFSGQEIPPAPRMATCQKCIRTADIENVGLTSRHGTFFEMLGSFSFGNYFKKESITWGWEFLTKELNMPVEKLWVTVYLDDEEAYNIWKDDVGFPEEKIVRLGKDDNFWEIGTGPCGPCSEIYFDRGPSVPCDNPDCKPGCDCDRYVEFWNHVFTQFSRQEDGSYVPLEHPNIDTGMGLERIACIMQDVDSIFDVDTIKKVLDEVCNISKTQYKHGKEPADISIRIITDHIRSATFMIGDKIMPSNEGRGYVLRRLIRRAVRHGKKLGIKDVFLGKLADVVIDTSKNAYPELETQKVYIKKIIENEENKFQATLNQGLDIIDTEIDRLKKDNLTVLEGSKAFKLHDTYGFPFEITLEILQEQGFSVDKAGFDSAMTKQKEMGKANANNDKVAWEQNALAHLFRGNTEFCGYEESRTYSKISALFLDEDELTEAPEGSAVNIICEKTPFYPKGGGQAGETGQIKTDTGLVNINNTYKKDNIIVHEGKVVSGKISTEQNAALEVDIIARNSSAKNHSATHLLHKALREALGEHVQQAGSQVDSRGLRFDFSHFEALSHDTLELVEETVNKAINSFLPVNCKNMSIEDAKSEGAIGLFEDKYGDTVRVVSMGQYSKELCGGIHVSNTGQIGPFKIVSESGIASGVRRIEAVTGEAVLKALKENESLVAAVSAKLKTNKDKILTKIEQLEQSGKELKKELEEQKKGSMDSFSKDLMDKAENLGKLRLITYITEEENVNDLKDLADILRSGQKALACLLIQQGEDKGTVVLALTDDLVGAGLHAGNIVKEAAKLAKGGGGGKADMAQAGIKDLSKINDMLRKAKELLG